MGFFEESSAEEACMKFVNFQESWRFYVVEFTWIARLETKYV